MINYNYFSNSLDFTVNSSTLMVVLNDKSFIFVFTVILFLNLSFKIFISLYLLSLA